MQIRDKDKHYYSFVDLEYVPVKSKLVNDDTHPEFSEIISIGLVIVDNEFNEVAYYHSLINPEHIGTINHRIEKLTSITNDEIRVASNFRDVFSEVVEMLNYYMVNRIYVLGTCEIPVLKDNILYSTDYSNNYSHMKRYNMFITSLSNIQPVVTMWAFKKNATGLPIPYFVYGLKSLTEEYNLDVGVGPYHNSLNDAIYLKNVVRESFFSYSNSHTLQSFKNFTTTMYKEYSATSEYLKMYNRQEAKKRLRNRKLALKSIDIIHTMYELPSINKISHTCNIDANDEEIINEMNFIANIEANIAEYKRVKNKQKARKYRKKQRKKSNSKNRSKIAVYSSMC